MKQLSILLVEDNEMISEALSEILLYAMPDLKIVVSRHEDEAVDLLTSQQFDVAIVDVMLKQGNGINVLKRSKAHKDGHWVVFSNHSKSNVREMARDSGADDVMDKSNEIESLVALLQKLAKD